MITAIAYFSIFFFAVDAQIYPSLLTEVASGSLGQGLILASSYFLFPVTAVASGYAADRIGKPFVLSIGALIMAVPFILGGVLTALELRILCALAFGIGGGAVESQGSALLSDLHPTRERSVLNISQVFYCIGAAGGPFLISLLYRAVPDIEARTILLAFGLGTLVLCPLFVYYGFRHGVTLIKHTEAPVKSLFQDKTFLLLCLSIFLYVSAEIGTASWLVRYGVEKLSLSLKVAPLLITFFWIGLGITRLLIGIFPLRISSLKLITVSFISAVVFQTISFILSNIYLLFASVTLLGCSLGTIWPTIVSIAGSYFKDKSGIAVGIIVASGAMGIPVISIIISAVSSISFIGIQGALLFLTLFHLGNLILLRCIRKNR